MRDENQTLDYFISEKRDFLVISFKGVVSKSTAAVLEKCEAHITARSAKFVVLSFHDVDRFEIAGVPPLVRLQKAIRSKPADLRICFLRGDHQRMLTEAGAIRPNELALDLVEALHSFPGSM